MNMSNLVRLIPTLEDFAEGGYASPQKFLFWDREAFMLTVQHIHLRRAYPLSEWTNASQGHYQYLFGTGWVRGWMNWETNTWEVQEVSFDEMLAHFV